VSVVCVRGDLTSLLFSSFPSLFSCATSRATTWINAEVEEGNMSKPQATWRKLTKIQIKKKGTARARDSVFEHCVEPLLLLYILFFLFLHAPTHTALFSGSQRMKSIIKDDEKGTQTTQICLTEEEGGKTASTDKINKKKRRERNDESSRKNKTHTNTQAENHQKRRDAYREQQRTQGRRKNERKEKERGGHLDRCHACFSISSQSSQTRTLFCCSFAKCNGFMYEKKSAQQFYHLCLLLLSSLWRFVNGVGGERERRDEGKEGKGVLPILSLRRQ
jgi:Skp family chaperone for outer membrane proteins